MKGRHKAVRNGLIVMLALSVALVVATFIVPSGAVAAPDPAKPDVICYCCQGYTWCIKDYGYMDVCHNGKLWWCHVKYCLDTCVGCWFRYFGYDCTYEDLNCTGWGPDCFW